MYSCPDERICLISFGVFTFFSRIKHLINITKIVKFSRNKLNRKNSSENTAELHT